MTKEEIEVLKAKHGPLMSVDEHIFTRPTRAEYDRFVDDKVAEKPMSVNARQLAQSCIVSPWADFMKDLDQRPTLLLNEVLSAILELAGVGGEATKVSVKKL